MSSKRFEYEDLEGLRVGRFPGRINTTCILYRFENTLIDTGPPNQWNEVQKFILEKDVKQICITHHHEDHCGNSSQIKKITNAELYSHKNGCDLLKRGWHMEPYRHIIWGRPQIIESKPAPPIIQLKKNLHLKCLNTPGHSDDSLCYLEPNRGWLFTGDVYITSRPHSLREDENPHDQINSLKFLLNHDFETLFCAHRGVVKLGKQAIQSKYNYLKELRDEVFYLHSLGLTDKEIRLKLLGRETLVSLLTLFNFCKQNFVRNFIYLKSSANQTAK
tara:strand:- start:11596 stop:12420 length:825 start_codon:yes stop_codon:yes gene_type:complete